MLVKGVLQPFTEPVGVDIRLEGLVLEAFFAALSCSRFCLDTEGAMVSVPQKFINQTSEFKPIDL